MGNGVQGAKLSKVSNLQGAAVLGYNQVQEDRKRQGETSRLERSETQLWKTEESKVNQDCTDNNHSQWPRLSLYYKDKGSPMMNED